MGYELDSGTIEWAKTRCGDLLSGEINVGAALERANNVVVALRESADQMDGQPESDVIRSYAHDIENILMKLWMCHAEIKKDRIDLGRAIIKYKEGAK